MSKIEWTDATWNPTTGCSRVSSGCDNCYAMHFARRFDGQGKGYDGTTRKGKNGTDWTGQVNLHEDRLAIPLRWRKPRMVFVNSMSDLFHPAIPFDFVDKVFAVMALARDHTFQVLTKQPDRMAAYLEEGPRWRRELEGLQSRGRAGWASHIYGSNVHRHEVWLRDHAPRWPLPNVWLGTSVENQETANERIPHLLRCPAAVRFLSMEPLLGPVDFRKVPGFNRVGLDLSRWWVIAGGESGPGARPMHPNWVRSIRDQCAASGVPFFFKQWGAWGYYQGKSFTDSMDPFRVGKKAAGRELDGRTHDAFPTPAGREVASGA